MLEILDNTKRKLVGKNKKSKVLLTVKCYCGNVFEVLKESIDSGNTKSCGCYNDYLRHQRAKHGCRFSRLYQTWSNMKQRCNNPLNNHYKYYGNKGIKVCNEWNEFKDFQLWAFNNGYNDTLSIERIDNSKGYSPDNCKWIPLIEQSKNQTSNVSISINGKRQIISEWAIETDIKYSTLHKRIKKLIRLKSKF